ncbi:hypothetical protein [Amycolatopsis sp. TNS106]|uniref:hypothetical protein n=1 Tax=Amycolatopsis sp. TNS106 TaxID=2861750 RepID=UPI001C572487|nr:hypothetical protein [Amycolatopsis sp. TNS106]
MTDPFLAASALNQILAVPTTGLDNLTSMTVWRSARRVTLIQVAVATAAGAAGTLAICARMDAPAFATVTVTIAGAGIIGLLAGLLPGQHHAWPAYVTAVNKLARTGQLPRNLMRFLDDAHRLGLLRAVGPAYHFRHAELEEHLAARYEQH